MIARLLEFLARHAMAVMAASVVLGLLWPAAARAMSPLLIPTIFVLLVAALLRQNWASVLREARRPARAALVFLWLVFGTPAVMLAAVSALDLPDGLAIALILMASSAPLISCIPFAVLLGLDAALATVVTLGATLLLPLYLPPLALTLLGLDLDIPFGTFMLRLAALVGGSFAFAWILRVGLGRGWVERQATRIDGVSVLMLMIFGVAIMDGVTAAFMERPELVLIYVAAAFAGNLGLQAVGAAVFLWTGWHRALTYGLLSGNRNMAILIGAMAGQADFGVLLFFAVAQLPIFILPAILQPVYRRLSRIPQRR